ncbi:MAG: hypothetical protein F6J97_03430 [Leptolyngbya sp. SIO4C1]|nr:hypothetical protein [Leptolyngbya sp. SIO4C1]
MSAGSGSRTTERCRARSYRRWHRLQSKLHILRSQLGFDTTSAAVPAVCQGCRYYHGLAYGTQQRVALVCAIHPYGWLETSDCPDWCC